MESAHTGLEEAVLVGLRRSKVIRHCSGHTYMSAVASLAVSEFDHFPHGRVALHDQLVLAVGPPSDSPGAKLVESSGIHPQSDDERPHGLLMSLARAFAHLEI